MRLLDLMRIVSQQARPINALPYALLGLLVVLLANASFAAASPPETRYWDADHLASLRENLAAASGEIKKSLDQLRRQASESLKHEPYSVVHKEIVPPSGDKHDYLSFSRYWWPNPDTENGLPYVRRDGEVNRKLLARGDRNRFGLFCDDVETLALAGYLLHDQEAAERARTLVKAWFLDEETRMTPRLKFSQGVPGRSVGRGTGIIDTRHFIRVIDSIALLHAIDVIEDKELTSLKAWFDEYATWLLQDELGEHERNAKNNHGSWYAAQVVGICLFTERYDEAREVIQEVRDQRIPKAFDADGSQPEELARTKSLHYSLFNLSALSMLARFGEPLGVDLWLYTPREGAGIAPAFRYITPYLHQPEKWPHPEMGTFSLSDHKTQTLLLAADRLNQPALITSLRLANKRYLDRNYAPLLFPVAIANKQSNSSSGSGYRVTVESDFTPSPLKINLPDLSPYTADSVRKARPASLPGEVRIAEASEFRLLDEAFRKDRGRDLQERQENSEPQVIYIASGVMTLQEVATQVDDDKIFTASADAMTLRLPLLVGPEATLVIDGKATPELRLSTDRGAFIANAGTLFVLDAMITSWSEADASPTPLIKKSQFRPFVSSYVRSETLVAGSQLQHLGFSAPTAYGFSLSSHPERAITKPSDDWPHGILVGNTFIGLYYGFYSFQARDVAIVDNDYQDCIVYGIDPHDRSTRLIIANNQTFGTKQKHGIIGSREVNHSWIFGNQSHHNAGTGIMLDRQCSHNVVVDNTVYKNRQGIAIYESPKNVAAQNLVAFNADTGIRVRNSTEITLQENKIVGNNDYALEVYAKPLKDHSKRLAKGDHYEVGVSADFFGNQVAGNHGFAKASHFQRLRIHNTSDNVDYASIGQQLSVEVPERDPNHNRNFSQELKPLKTQLRPLFDDQESLFTVGRTY